MQSAPVLAIFVEDSLCQASLTGPDGAAVTLEFPNTDAGLDQFLQWARSVIGGEVEPRWVVTLPHGDGGVVYRWLYDEIPDLFMQNPDRLKEYGAKVGIAWNTALALHDFNRSKQW
jgi:hypothetical protein